MQILVVDDDPIAIQMIAAIIEEAGHQAVMAENAVQAMQMVSEQQPDLIVSDNHMPLMDGPELCRELRAQGFKNPFILLSGDDYEQKKDMKTDISAYIIKDFSLADTLNDTINRLMT